MNKEDKLKLFFQDIGNEHMTAEKAEALERMLSSDGDEDTFRALVDEASRNAPHRKLSRSKARQIRRTILFEVKTRGTQQKTRWVIVAAITIGVMIGLSVWQYALWYLEPVVADQPPVQVAHRPQQLTLPDGTSVLLNDHSELHYHESFGTAQREVWLTGEAYFDVAHDAAHPFIVHTGAVKTTVLGTAFNVQACENKSEVIVTVDRGKVVVGDDKQVYDQLLPEEQLTVHTNTLVTEKVCADTVAIRWKEELLVFDHISMTEAARLIGKRFGVKVDIINPALRNCTVRAKFSMHDNLYHVVSGMCQVMNASYTIEEDGRVTIDGGEGC